MSAGRRSSRTGGRGPSSSTLRLRGVITVVIAAAVVALIVIRPFSGEDKTVDFTIAAPSLPDGIQKGIPVDIRGETVGTVCGLDISRPDAARVKVCVKQSQAGEITDDVAVSYASRNLFGSDALRLVPTATGNRVRTGSVISLAAAPADNTMTATVRSAGSFTLPVLTPDLSRLLTKVSDTTVRLSPFLTSAALTLQTLDRGQTTGKTITRLRRLMPTAADAIDGVGEAGAGGIKSLETILTTPLLADHEYTARVQTMIGDIGALFSDLGALFSGMSDLGATMDVITAFTTPMSVSLRNVTADQIAGLIDRFGNVFHKDPATGKTVVRVSANLDVAPGVAGPLGVLLSGRGIR